ncbi:2-oxoglutarate dehydrogenase, E2 component, dihydrolipoamide succinyltransferase [Amycolatopsis sp. CA-230715]|uniref:2-oxoglutarate dehydrogenase, E2 component, dihydrolipoamide succinyltransferase n=1 Tax=Amycolatopsis sp. CA-230715 TaxID=2745196 RepID=UPI001C01E076|nr:2-oxoglutarate dehydrogenase, E2 component, dihydrolipoamide succinyltransferase [Amycolatopsis sp. CA-230715]QWF83158.1 Dihydrolipoyllysine-residue acetyltransferase component of pyruvate dehydrogenase complex [Amycolatopsis sp. CA-230715]
MAYSVTLPELGESVTEGTVTRWLKKEGDRVEVDEPLLEISTDKVDTEVPSPVAGTVQKISAQEDETVEVGGELAVIDDGSGGAAPAPAEPPKQEAPQQEEAPAPQQQEAPAPAAAPAPSGGGSASGTSVTLPELGESVTEGTVTRWLKQVGDSVEVDEPLLEISTDKVDTEVPSPVAGTVLEISVDEDETVEVGGQLAVIGDAGAAPAAKQEAPAAPKEEPKPEPTPEPVRQEAPKAEPKPEPTPQPAPAPAAPAPAASTSDSSGSGPYVTPLVRKLASEHGIELDSLKGSGVGGRIRKQDVLAAVEEQQKAQPAPAAAAPAAAAPSAPAAPSQPTVSPEKAALRGTVQKANRIRQITAIKTKESLQVSAQLTQVHEVDVTKVARLRQRAKAAFKAREGINLTFLPFFAKATVEALKQHPNINASYNEETKEITYHGDVHLGLAVDTEKGLLNVVMHNAGDLNLAGLAHKIADLAARARSNKIKPDELAGGTFTITNIGSNGALFDTPIIMQPQSGMLGTGAVVKRPVVIADAEGNDTIAVRSMAFLPLTYDHRLIDGADAGRFLTTIKQRLEEGNFEDELGL